MKTNPIRRRGFTLVELLVVIVIIASLAALSAPMIMGKVKQAYKAEAISNSKQIGLAMFEFEADYGTYPDSDTKADVDKAFPDSLVKGDAGADSNGYFKQLFQAGIVKSEEIFYAKAKGTKKPDGDVSKTEVAIGDDECGFGYILDADKGMNTSGNPSRVLLVTPLATSTSFDAEPFGGVAVVYKIDNSASALKIRPAAGKTTGPAIVGGKELMDADFWGTDADPKIVGQKSLTAAP